MPASLCLYWAKNTAQLFLQLLARLEWDFVVELMSGDLYLVVYPNPKLWDD